MSPRTLTLYYAPPSICSCMIDMTFAMRDRRELSDDAYVRRVVDFSTHDQLAEDYLLKLNWKGHVRLYIDYLDRITMIEREQVPVLVDSMVEKPIPETLAITRHLRSILPSLFPEQHRERIDELLAALHAHNFWTMTYTMRPDGKEPDRTRGNAIADGCKERLARDGISPEYRAALERKLKHHQAVKMDALADDVAHEEHNKLRRYLADIKAEHDEHGGPWLFGSTYTVLDAQLTPLMHRLRKVGKWSLIVEAGLQVYADRLLSVPDWEEVGKQC